MRLNRKVDKYVAVTLTNLRSNLTYVGELVYRTTFILMILYIFIQLWKTAYGGEEQSAGMTLIQTIWYLVITEAIILSKTSVAQTIAQEVRDGSLAYSINRPYSYLMYHFFNGLGDTFLRLVINFIAGSILVTYLIGLIPVKPWVLLPVLLTILLALILDYCISALIGLFAFKMEDISSFLFIYQKILFILGGVLILLDFFPSWLKVTANLLPFGLIIYAPAKLFVNFSWAGFWEVAGFQVLWSLVFVILLTIVYRNGIRKVTLNGG